METFRPSVEEISHLKYVELQRLAKKAGIKANATHKKLAAALVKYYKTETKGIIGNGELGSENSPVQPEATSTELRTTSEIVPSMECVNGGTDSVGDLNMSPDASNIQGEMKSEMSNEEMKKTLMSDIDMKVQAKCGSVCGGETSSSIPRFAAFLAKKRELKPTTPGTSKKPLTPGGKDWARIHQRNFEKFDSIDVYLNKKKRRAEEITASVKKAKNILAEVQASVTKLKSHKTPTGENMVKKPRDVSSNKTTPFKPTVVNLSEANFNFGGVKCPKTVPRISPKSVVSSVMKKSTPNAVRRKSTSNTAAKKPLTTPFKFTGALNVTVNRTQSVQKKFDLQASLAKPLTWKPHRGKLKAFHEKSPYKKTTMGQNIAKSRDARRAVASQSRADKKYDQHMARRGMNI